MPEVRKQSVTTGKVSTSRQGGSGQGGSDGGGSATRVGGYSSQKNGAGGTIFDRIAPVSQVDSGGLKVSIYGRPKVGKTRFLGTFPKPLLILGAEDGTRSIRNVKGVDFIRLIGDKDKIPLDGNGKPIKSFIRLNEMPDLLSGLPGKYKSVGVDTASSMADLILAGILGLEELPPQKSWGMVSREQYGQQALQMKTLLRSIIALTCNVVITAHERNFTEEGKGSEMLTPTIGSALSPSIAGWLNGAVDYVCQSFVREQTIAKSMTINKKEVTTRSKTGKAEYCLRVGPHEVYLTGFRLSPGQVLPDVIVNPSYDKIMEIINSEVKKG